MAERFSSRASCSPAPKRAKCGVRHHLQVTFSSNSMKEGFLARLDRAKLLLFPGASAVDNYRLLTGLLDALDGRLARETSQAEGPLVSSATPEPLLDSSG